MVLLLHTSTDVRHICLLSKQNMQVDYFESEFNCVLGKSSQDKQDDTLSHTWEVSIEREIIETGELGL